MKSILKSLEFCGIPLMYKEQYQIADKQYIIDISKSQKLLHWNPKADDKDMLFEAFAHYKMAKQKIAQYR